MSFIWIFSTHWKTGTARDSRNHSLKGLMASPEQLHKPCLCQWQCRKYLMGRNWRIFLTKCKKKLTWGLLNQCRFEPGSNLLNASEPWTELQVRFSTNVELWTGLRSSSQKVWFEVRFWTELRQHYTQDLVLLTSSFLWLTQILLPAYVFCNQLLLVQSNPS